MYLARVMWDRSSSGLFAVDWLLDGSVALCASNGRYVTARMNGSLNAVADGVTSDRERFHVTIINRAQLVLRCEYGFVGFRSDAHPRIECNKTTYDVISVEHSGGENAEYMYFLKGLNCLSVSQSKHQTSAQWARDCLPYTVTLTQNLSKVILCPKFVMPDVCHGYRLPYFQHELSKVASRLEQN